MKNEMKPKGNNENASFNLKNEKAQRNQTLSHNTIKKLKKQVKGITLIALVVTIIVLLILAGIALNLTIGENGIFSRAQTATNTWENAEANEQAALDNYASVIDKYLNGNGGAPEVEEGTLLAMYLQAIEDECTNEDGTCDNPNHLHIGDYVQFANPTNKEATALATDTGWESNQHYTVNSSTNQLNWRVLGIDSETGGIKLIAATPLKADDNDGYLVMYGAQSYVTGYLVPDQISEEIYGNLPYVEKARSVKIEDINEIFNMSSSEIGRYDLFSLDNGTGADYGKNYSYENAYTPSSYLDEKNNDKPENSGRGHIEGTVDGYYYGVASQKLEDVDVPYKIEENKRIYEMIFGDTETGKLMYYLSSRGVVSDSSNAYFGPGAVATGEGIGGVISNGYFFYSDGNEYEDGASVRPVVSLESGVKAIDVPKLADQTNPSWGDSGGEDLKPQ